MSALVLPLDRPTQLPHLWDQVWQATWETSYIVAITVLLGGLLGLALGLSLYATRRGGLFANRPAFVVLNLVVNFFRPIPFVIFMAAVQPLARIVVGIGIGNRAIIFALTLGAMFGISRIVEQNLVTVGSLRKQLEQVPRVFVKRFKVEVDVASNLKIICFLLFVAGSE